MTNLRPNVRLRRTDPVFIFKSRLGTKWENLSSSQSHVLVVFRPLEYVHRYCFLFSTNGQGTIRRKDSDSSTSAKLGVGRRRRGRGSGGTVEGVRAGTTTLGDDNGGKMRVAQRWGSSRSAGPPCDRGLQKVSERPAGWLVGRAAAPYRATSPAPAAAAGPRA